MTRPEAGQIYKQTNDVTTHKNRSMVAFINFLLYQVYYFHSWSWWKKGNKDSISSLSSSFNFSR